MSTQHAKVREDDVVIVLLAKNNSLLAAGRKRNGVSLAGQRLT